MGNPKIFSEEHAENGKYELDGENKVIIYRFGNSKKTYNWLSRRRLQSNGPFIKPDNNKLNDWALKQTSYGSKMENIKDNPFISVATSYKQLYKGGEGWVQEILKNCPTLGKFSVPFSTLYRPRPTKIISKQETEWLYYDGDKKITDYLIVWWKNPYKK